MEVLNVTELSETDSQLTSKPVGKAECAPGQRPLLFTVTPNLVSNVPIMNWYFSQNNSDTATPEGSFRE